MVNKLLVALLSASAINAQYNLTYLHLMGDMEPTLTLMGSDDTATTFEKTCPETTTTPISSATEHAWWGMFCFLTVEMPLTLM
jgi:hypothetical protein